MQFTPVFVLILFTAATLHAQSATPAQPQTPLWDAQIGASFIGTSGNTDTATTGLDFTAHRRGPIWQIDSNATAIRTNDNGTRTAERYLGQLRTKRRLSPLLGVSIGERAERDLLSGIAYRNIADASLAWSLVRMPSWTLDGTTGVGWDHETRPVESSVDTPVGLAQLVSRIPFGSNGETTQRFTFYPDFHVGRAYREEAEITAQAALAAHFALKLGYLLRYSNRPVAGFGKTDTTATASIVVRWKASTPAPPGDAP